jgi:hypothetical protein
MGKIIHVADPDYYVEDPYPKTFGSEAWLLLLYVEIQFNFAIEQG